VKACGEVSSTHTTSLSRRRDVDVPMAGVWISNSNVARWNEIALTVN
jgi:hypothetical protein